MVRIENKQNYHQWLSLHLNITNMDKHTKLNLRFQVFLWFRQTYKNTLKYLDKSTRFYHSYKNIESMNS